LSLYCWSYHSSLVRILPVLVYGYDEYWVSHIEVINMLQIVIVILFRWWWWWW
jgi:hypothetical protein